MSITLIGDVHAYSLQYLRLIKRYTHTVQLGDMGFEYDHMAYVDSAYHKVIGGNHDNYDIIHKLPHYLGDFGVYELNGVKFFFVRGALSVDRHLRREGKDWWEKEQLTYAQGLEAIDLYEKTKPEIVLSHDCPEFIVPHVLTNEAKRIPSITNQLLQAMFDTHKPNQWFFGHHHNNRFVEAGPTLFRCVDELSTITIPI